MKTQRVVCAIMLCALLCGCVNHINDEEEEIREKTIVFKTTIGISQTPMRAASKSASKLLISDYQDGVEVQKIEQSSTDSDFGKVAIPLKYGEHELLFVGHNSGSTTLSYPTISFDKPTDTFSYYLSLKVNESTNTTQNVTLPRSAALLKVVAKDAIPSNVKSLKISLAKYYPVLNVKSSLGDGSGSPVERVFEYKASHVGEKETTYSIYTFTPADGFTTDISISALDADGNTVNQITMKDVPIEKNRQTILSGNIFQLSSDANITFNDQWGEAIELPI